MKKAFYLLIVLWFARKILHRIIPSGGQRYLCLVELTSGDTYCFASYGSMLKCQEATMMLRDAIRKENLGDFVLGYGRKDNDRPPVGIKVNCRDIHNIWNENDDRVNMGRQHFPSTFELIRKISRSLCQDVDTCRCE